MRSRLLASLAVLTLSAPVGADVVVRRDGVRVEGRVASLDAEWAVVTTDRGPVRIRRQDVATIELDRPSPPLKVEVRNVRSDDAVDVLLDDEVVLHDGSEGGEWIDLTPKLKEGNNALRLRIRNDRGTWAYRLSVRINGQVTPLACGTPQRSDDPCRCCGKTGRETGVIDDLPIVWLHVDRSTGRAEVLP